MDQIERVQREIDLESIGNQLEGLRTKAANEDTRRLGALVEQLLGVVQEHERQIVEIRDGVDDLAGRLSEETPDPEPTSEPVAGPHPDENALLVERIQALMAARNSIEVMIGWAQRKLVASGE